MHIMLMATAGLQQALFGIGMSFGLTSGEAGPQGLSGTMQARLEEIASRLCRRGGGEDKFLRQVMYWWDVKAPRYWWAEADTYKIGTTAQSESTMHRLTGRPLTQGDFERPISLLHLALLNKAITEFNESRGDASSFMQLKNELPEGFLQRRIWSLSLAGMKNIFAQRRKHKLPQWRTVCQAFYEATPEFLRGMYAEARA